MGHPVLATPADAAAEVRPVLEEFPHDEAAAEVDRWRATLSPAPSFAVDAQANPVSAMARSARAAVHHPDPEAKNGVPDGWVVKDRANLRSGKVEHVLVRREAGGWLILRHQADTASTTMYMAGSTLVALYDYFSGLESPVGQPHQQMAEWLRGVLMETFDPTDPDEVAEQALFAMGGSLTFVPRAAR